MKITRWLLAAGAFLLAYVGTRLACSSRLAATEVRANIIVAEKHISVNIEWVTDRQAARVEFEGPRTRYAPTCQCDESPRSKTSDDRAAFFVLPSAGIAVFTYTLNDLLSGDQLACVPMSALLPTVDVVRCSWHLSVTTTDNIGNVQVIAPWCERQEQGAEAQGIPDWQARSGALVVGPVSETSVNDIAVVGRTGDLRDNTNYIEQIAKWMRETASGSKYRVVFCPRLSALDVASIRPQTGFAIVGQLPLNAQELRLQAEALFWYQLMADTEGETIPISSMWLACGLCALRVEELVARLRPADASDYRSLLTRWYNECAPVPIDPTTGLGKQSRLDEWVLRRRLAPAATLDLMSVLKRRGNGEEHLLYEYLRWHMVRRQQAAEPSALQHAVSLWVDTCLASQRFCSLMSEKLPTTECTISASQAEEVTICVSAGTSGYLESCGCNVNAHGGAARRNTYLADARKERDAILLDLGACMPCPDTEKPTPMDAALARVVVDVLNLQHYDVIVPDVRDLQAVQHFGSEYPHAMLRTPDSKVTITRKEEGLPITGEACKSVCIIPWIARRLQPPSADAMMDNFRPQGKVAAGEIAESSVATVLERISALRDSDALIVIAGHVPPSAIRMLAETGARAVVLTTNRRVTFTSGQELSVGYLSTPTRVGAIVVVPIRDEPYGVTSVRIGWNSRERSASGATAYYQELWENLEEDAATRDRIERFYSASASKRDWNVAPLRFAQPGESRYIGSQKCAQCHANAYRQWANTPHRNAFNTLLKVRRQFLPECVICHVVGLGEASGFNKSEGRTSHLAGVGCESCHGPGEQHATSGRHSIQRGDVNVCKACHNSKHSPAFEAAWGHYLERIRHW